MSLQAPGRRSALPGHGRPEGVDTSTPVVVLNVSSHCPLAVARSLGRWGVPVHGVTEVAGPATASRYFGSIRLLGPGALDRADEVIEMLAAVAAELGGRPVLVATGDAASELVAERAEHLAGSFRVAQPDISTYRRCYNKATLPEVCAQAGVPSPLTVTVGGPDDVAAFLEAGPTWPVMVKASDPWATYRRTGLRLAPAEDPQALRELYRLMGAPDGGGLLFQEFVPGGTDSNWIFNGYAGPPGVLTVGFTGLKLRQCPPIVGSASFGVQRANPEVMALARLLLGSVGYQGLVDLDFRLDLNDGRYKLLDFNPRIGASFRLFADVHGLDVVQAMYLHLTGQAVAPGAPAEGRCWMIENDDVISLIRSRQEGRLGLIEWSRSLPGVDEVAWWSADDPRPALAMYRASAGSLVRWLGAGRPARRGASLDAPAAGGSLDAPAAGGSLDAPAPGGSLDAPAPGGSLDAPALGGSPGPSPTAPARAGQPGPASTVAGLPGPAFTVGTLSGPDLLDRLGTDLDDLHEATGVPVTARRPWLSAWVGCFHQFEPWAVVVRDGSGVLHAAALLANTQRMGVSLVRALGQGPSDYVRLPARSVPAAEALAAGIIHALASGPTRRHWVLHVEQLPVDDPVATSLARRLRAAVITPGDASPVTRFLPGDGINDHTSHNFRSQARRKRRGLETAGIHVESAVLTQPDEVEAVIPELLVVRRRRDDQMVRVGWLDTAPGVEFYRRVLVALAGRGELEVVTLRCNGELAAFTASALDGSSYRVWDNRIDPAWGRWSPGSILELELFQRLLAEGRVTEFDRMRGEEAYKRRTANATVPASQVRAWSSPAVRRADEGWRQVRSSARDVGPVARIWTARRRRGLQA